MKVLGFSGILMILSEMAKILAGIPCETNDVIGYYVDVENLSNMIINDLCSPPDYDLDMNEDNECPNEIDILSQYKCSDNA